METPSSNRLLGVLFVGVLMGALDIAIVGPALPAIQESFAISSRDLAWIFTIYVLFNLVATPLMAKLSDRFGRRDIYLLDVTLFALGSLLVALSPTFGVLLGGRALQALGAGGIFPVASAVIGDTFPPEKRGSALGIIGAVFGLAFLIGPLLGGILLRFGWHWLFLINLPIAVWLIVQSIRLLPATRPETVRPFDWIGMVSLALALAALAYGISQLDSNNLMPSLVSARVLPFLLLAAVLTPIFWRIEKGAPDPVVRPSLLSGRQVLLTGAFAAGAGLSETSLVFLPALAVSALGMGHAAASFMLFPTVLALAVGSPLAGRLLDRLGSRSVVLSGLILTALGLLLYGLSPIHLGWFILAGALVGLGLSALLGAPLRYILLNEASDADRGAAQGLLTVFTSIGQLLGGALVGAVAASQGGGAHGYRSALLLIGLLTAVMIPPAVGLKGLRQERGVEPHPG